MNNASEGSSGTEDDVISSNRSTPTMALELYIANMLWTVWPPCLLLLGGFGNIATIFVMRRIKDHNSSQYAILMALAVTDLLLLSVGALRPWLQVMYQVDVRDLHTLLCKGHHWLVYTCSTTSGWLVTDITVQRTMAIRWPHRIRVLCSTERTWIAIAAVALTAGLLHLHFMGGMELIGSKCDYVSREYRYFFTIWHWVDLCITSLFPSVCLLVCDVILSVALFKATSALSMGTQTATSVQSDRVTDSRRRVASRTTVMILVLSCTFLLLTLPVNISLIWYHFVYYSLVQATPQTKMKTRLAVTVSMILWYTNSAVNFLLYCFTGTKFRREFLAWIRCRPRSLNAAASGNEAKSSSGQRS